MIPIDNSLPPELEYSDLENRTYQMHRADDVINGFTDGIEAIKQAAYKILNTERYIYTIYSPNYGIELADLLGEPFTYVYPELERRIEEALTQDERIVGVDNFTFEVMGKQSLKVNFDIHTVMGDFEEKLEVDF